MLQAIFPRFQAWITRQYFPHDLNREQPLRAELLSVEQLTRFAHSLAEAHQISPQQGQHRLLAQLDQNEQSLRSFNHATHAVHPNQRLTPAAEWMLDNFYLLEEQIQMARRHLPPSYSRELPLLVNPLNQGFPRVYDLVLELISHVDAQIDGRSLSSFVDAYQKVTPLKLGELWAIPIMLRLALIENLQRITQRLTLASEESDLAVVWIDRLQDMAEKNPSNLVVVVADMARSDFPVSSAFVAEFCQRLSRHSPVLHMARTWLEQRLVAQGLSTEQLIHLESQNQAADQVSVSHSIASLRFLSAMDWKAFVETLSLVEQTLHVDPACVYTTMDFATRDRYRHAVEFLARHSPLSEVEVAQAAIQLAEKGAEKAGNNDRLGHVGYYLVDKGLSDLGERIQVRWPLASRMERLLQRSPLLFYTGGISLFTLLATLGFVRMAQATEIQGWRFVLFSLLFLLSSSQLALAFVNGLTAFFIQPHRLPRLDFTAGIVPECETMVVVPTMLTSLQGVDQLIENLEIHHLSNRDAHLHFGLLTDFADAETESRPEDLALLQRARAGIQMLNQKYLSQSESRFYLFHRPRTWNAAEGLWMGYERKRGKLMAFNSLLRGGEDRAFEEIVGDLQLLPLIKYVITLDTDTQLPRDTARTLVGTMAHPLNRPVFDPARGVVAEGYSILQPRMGVSLPSARRSWFVWLFAGEAGIDPYTQEVSDVYQDLFQEGSFIGKGIYDVDAFQRAMEGRFPENKVLSHDLLEACHARSALISDVELYEAYPYRYNVDMKRRHRWIRGDWQIAQWLLPRVPGPDARKIANPLSALSQWKIFDNLRRSLIPIALLSFLLGSWFCLPELGGLGILLVLPLIVLPNLISLVFNLLRKPEDSTLKTHLRTMGVSSIRQMGHVFLILAFLPYDAYMSLDAIGRTLMRLLLTRKRLLEWHTSSDSELTLRTDLGSFYVNMWIVPSTALVTGLLLVQLFPRHLLGLLPWALPLLLVWLAAPWIAWWISQPLQAKTPKLQPEQLRFLRQTARKTWHFFEVFVSAEENHLPPDNFQEFPKPTIASRTSPTNMGLALMANLAAWDFGYLSLSGFMTRTQNALSSMQKLERYRGHFYNWYDTRSLQPLLPHYVSSVDSGNLAGNLLTLSAGLRGLGQEVCFSGQAFAGLQDTLQVLVAEAAELPLNPVIARFSKALATVPNGLRERLHLWGHLSDLATELLIALSPEKEPLKMWGQILSESCLAQHEEMDYLLPWLALERPLSLQEPHMQSPLVLALDTLESAPSLLTIAQAAEQFRPLILDALQAFSPSAEQGISERAYLASLLNNLDLASHRAQIYLSKLEDLATEAEQLGDMDFGFLYEPSRALFSIGFNVSERRMDNSFYDLLASEARLCSYIAIALGQVPQDHWFSLGRLLVASQNEPLLVSWSGSMFEYLMPMLVMPTYENTMLAHSCQAAVKQQIAYGKLRGVPWGISESGYNRTDVQLNYQYRAFGVPGLGLKRGLAEDLVIAPYASAMALMVDPLAACENLIQLAAEGREGQYGFYEAIDYTPARLNPDESSALICSYMAHHQGMSLLALLTLLQDSPMQKRFMAYPPFKAAELLLQERVPKTAASIFAQDLELEVSRILSSDAENAMRIFTNPSPHTPDVHLLSNGRYHLAISSAGSGYSRWNELAVTRWREDVTRDPWGSFVYLRDLASGDYWSAAFHPSLRPCKNYEAIFTQARAEFRHQHASLEVHTEISVSPEDDVELRRIRITNRSSVQRRIELTSYSEVVLTSPAAEAMHPAFNNLFIQTEFLPEASALLCSRRASSPEETPPWLLHLMLVQAGETDQISCETDRLRFIGRGGTLQAPLALKQIAPLSNTVGAVLDPIVSLRRTVILPPHATTVVDVVLGMAETRDLALAQIEKYQSSLMADRAFDLAWTHSQVTLRQLNATDGEAQLYGRLAKALIFADASRRASPTLLRSNTRSQSGLWSYGISGDVPIVLLQIRDSEKMELVRQLIRAHSYWRMKGLAVELVILNEDVSVYRQSLHDQITSLIAAGIEAQMLDRPNGIFVRRLEQIPNDDRLLLMAVARIILDDENGSLAEQIELRSVRDPVMPELVPSRLPKTALSVQLPKPERLFENGIGGFAPDGREYVIVLEPGQMTPAPWVNVIANPFFGTLVSESGGGYTWFENAHEYRLTPWSNDPVGDPPGEAFYIRDEQTGEYWSPMPAPARGKTAYTVRHGFGYSVFEHSENGIRSELWVYVAKDAPVKFSVLKLTNLSGRPRRISVSHYCEWVLGDLRAKSLLHVQTQIDLKTGALLARNYYNSEFADCIAFLDVNDISRTFSGDRKEFIGRNRDLSQPAALKRTKLSGKVGAGLDPCAAVQVFYDLAVGQEREIIFRLGVSRSLLDVQNLIQRFRRTDAAETALKAVLAYWHQTLGQVQIETPDPAVNIPANGWLLYQVLSCRLWGRTGFYQSGGAFGFRDQLQDVMALVHSEPGLMREHLLRAAAHQFREGDVQHWWHPPSGRGVRTHFSDDYLWLPFVLCHYVRQLADTGILDEKVPFLEGRPVQPEEEAYYDLHHRSEESASLYEHAVRAIERGMERGIHGLPLMGSGDWNDGMNRVGSGGKGESVWLAFFLYDVLNQFASLAEAHGDSLFARRCHQQAQELQTQIEANGWDGQWYLRAYFDNGEKLGSHTQRECQIDALPQSWSVISGAASLGRSREAMRSVDLRLIRRKAGLIQLFDPPFQGHDLNPGYIQGYMPGVRENGGQYTHAAIWTVMAFAMMGESEKAWALFKMLNPIQHTSSPEQIAVYKVEPYVVAADVYAVAPHMGRGGWTWYTGSASWMYRLLLENLLGIERRGDFLILKPLLPLDWDYFKIHYRFKQTLYHIHVCRKAAEQALEPLLVVDGLALEGNSFLLSDDSREHDVTFTLD